MDLSPEVLAAEFGKLVGEAHIDPASPQDRIDGAALSLIVSPGNAEEVAAVLRRAREIHLPVTARGGGTKIGWGNPPEAVALSLSTRRLDQVRDHAWGDMTATVEAGCRFSHLQQILEEHGQRLALDPLWPERATVGGIVATNDSGSLRERFGALRDQLLGVTISLADGTLARSGGRVVKNVAGYDLPKLLIGSLGTLGVITELTFRLYPVPRQTQTFSFRLPSYTAMQALVRALRASTLAPTGIQIRSAGGDAPQLDIRFEGDGPVLAAQAQHLGTITAAAEPVETDPAVWQAREALWEDAADALLCRVSVLPMELAWLCESLQNLTQAAAIRWTMVAQAVGTGIVRFDASDSAAIAEPVKSLREALEARDGSLVLLNGPAAIKQTVDVWGAVGTALPLMRRIKDQFDPQRILNPGRFVGGI